MPQVSPTLANIKALNWLNSSVSFYVVKRRLVKKSAHYEVLLVNIGENIQQNLQAVFQRRLSSAQGVMEYDFNTVDQDDNLLTITTSETDFQSIVDTITGIDPPEIANSQNQLFDAWFYVTRLYLPNQLPLFAVRRAPKGWATKKNLGAINLIFSSHMELVLEDKAIFKIDDYFDFFSYAGTIFIFYKNNFELDLNFREGMIQDKHDVIAEFEQLNVFQSTDGLELHIGNNLRLLRKIAKVKELGYYRDSEFLISLRQANEERNLGLEYDDDGLLIMTAEKVELILHFFTNGRVESIINQELFDVDAKRPVQN